MLIDTLRAQRDDILALSRQYGARRIRIFGSVARGEEQTDSDIDFLVGFPPRLRFIRPAIAHRRSPLSAPGLPRRPGA